ncbi:MAG TPA: penicillin-binding transpeptidase domain-containing protein, partial [Longimicrobiales bacterium]|nr:penicillin-binding transpeptidase domain-containing protein [Longimicrobiales bacterium]
RVKDRRNPSEVTRVMKASTAASLTKMMEQVVSPNGTAPAAQIAGIQVAGKTGTAEVDNGAANQAWFIAFAPATDPKIAIAVTIERTQGEGGQVAAPIAKAVMEKLLGRSGG